MDLMGRGTLNLIYSSTEHVKVVMFLNKKSARVMSRQSFLFF